MSLTRILNSVQKVYIVTHGSCSGPVIMLFWVRGSCDILKYHYKYLFVTFICETHMFMHVLTIYRVNSFV